MKKLIKKIAWKFGIELKRYARNFVSLTPKTASQGNVLLSYILEPFTLKAGESIPSRHTHFWESWQIAQTFLDLGYAVDVINYYDDHFIPKKSYKFFVGARTNFERIAKFLNRDCVKIVHLDMAHWIFNNLAAYTRYSDLQEKRGIALRAYRMKERNWAIEAADYATILGNDFTVSTYSYANKRMFPISVPSYRAYPWPRGKNYDRCRKHFLWFGGRALAHKGLDLVLESFAGMPDYHLTVCGPISEEKDFEDAYSVELYQTPNIHTNGWVDVCSSQFTEITDNCIGLIYPSSSEGQSGAVVTCLQAALIPIISYESGVDVHDFGFILEKCTIDEIRNTIETVSSLSARELKVMARKAWEFARANHTREKFAEQYREIIKDITSST